MDNVDYDKTKETQQQLSLFPNTKQKKLDVEDNEDGNSGVGTNTTGLITGFVTGSLYIENRLIYYIYIGIWKI